MRLITGSLRVVRFKKLRDWPTLIINVLSCKKNALIKSKTGPHFLSKGVGCLLASLQGVPLEKKLERNDCSSDTVHILPQVGKAETNLKGGRVFFHFSRICLGTFFKVPTASQTHFGFTNMGSNMYLFPIFSNGTPCK